MTLILRRGRGELRPILIKTRAELISSLFVSFHKMSVNSEERESLRQGIPVVLSYLFAQTLQLANLPLKIVFKIFDKDGDGTVSISEFTQVLEHLGVSSGEDEARSIIKRVGRRNSNSMNFEEFVEAIEAATHTHDHHACHEQELQACFRAFDKNGDGRISFEELEMAMKELGENMSYQELQEMMNDGDTDNDGMIDFEEFKRLMPAA